MLYNTYGNPSSGNKKYNKIDFLSHGKKCSEVRKMEVEDFVEIVYDVKKKVTNLTSYLNKFKPSDSIYIDINSAIVKGTKTVNIYEEMLEKKYEVSDASKKDSMCCVYFEFNEQYNIINNKISGV